MSRDMSMPSAQVEVFAVHRRRLYSAEESRYWSKRPCNLG